jgi:hypothetical protein
MAKNKVALLLVVGCLLVPVALGQISQDTWSAPGAARTMQVPLPHLYWHFLILQNHLDREAAAKEHGGQDGSALHAYYQKRIGFSDSQFAQIREAGLRLEPQLKAIDAEVRTVIENDRAHHPRVLSSPADLPAALPELAQLQQKREQVIAQEVDSLKLALGSRQTAKLEMFLSHEFASKVTAQRVTLPTARTMNPPRRDPTLRPFPQQQEAQ